MSNRIDLDDPNYNQNQNRVVIQDNKAKLLWVALGIIGFILIVSIIVLLSGSGDNSSSSPDPNRTSESCSYYGTAKVFGSAHDSTYCTIDGDGYYNPVFGHHHHK